MEWTTVPVTLVAMALAVPAGNWAAPLQPAEDQPVLFNFGPAGTPVPEPLIDTGNLLFDAARGWGWDTPPDTYRQRNMSPNVTLDTLAGASARMNSEAVFRVSLEPGGYLVEVGICDMQFRYTAEVYLQDETVPWIDGGIAQAGTVTTERREVIVTGEGLRVRIPPSDGGPYAMINYLAIWPGGTNPPPLPVFEQPELPIEQPDLADTPVEYTLGTAARLEDLVSNASPWHELSDPDRPGMWCWFQDPRAIVDTSNPDRPMLVTGVVTYADAGNPARGDIDLYWANLATVGGGVPLERGRFELDDQLQMDDHASPAFMIRPDGRYLVTWSMHGNDRIVRSRISTNPGDPTVWNPTVRNEPTGVGITYTNPFYLAGPGVTFNGIRSTGFDSQALYSTDLGETWRHAGRIVDAPDPWPDHGNGGRAYVKYAGDGESRIYFIATDDHPDVNFNISRTARGPHLNSIFAGYIENETVHDMDGTVLDANLSDQVGTPPTALTVLMKDGTPLGDVVLRRGWQVDIKTTPDGLPVAIFQMRADDDPEDHRYFYARHDGEKYNVYFLAHAGANFGRRDQPDYTGLATVDPMNPDVVYVSTNRHPITNEYLVSSTTGQDQFEIFMGRTGDGGATWEWAAVTENSPTDNIRPYSPGWQQGLGVVLWMRGDYPSFYVYDTKVMMQAFELKPAKEGVASAWGTY